MNTIILDGRRLKAYERLRELAACVGRDEAFVERLWRVLVEDAALMTEFAYYLDHHAILNELKCSGYGIMDIYVWMIERFNLRMDYGKMGRSATRMRWCWMPFWR